jgi:hypothetical protein
VFGFLVAPLCRLRLIGAAREPTRLAPLIKPILDRISDTNLRNKIPKFLPKTIHLPVTTGANFIFWSWLCIAFSDVGGYFAGRKFGKTKLEALSPAAGKASPNKTVEGVIGGCVFSMVLATLGAWVQKWPYWAILGPIHGVMLALLGLVGDLTASLLKRDAGLKDFGDLIPEHGGIMDRVDSYVRIIVCSICLRFTTRDSCLLITYLCPLSSRFSRLLMDILSAHILSHGLKLLPGPRPLPP